MNQPNEKNVLIIIVALIALGFATPAHATQLSFIADGNYSVGSLGPTFGGASGMTYDPVSDELLVLSDDRGELAPPRFYRSKFSITHGSISFRPESVNPLRKSGGAVFEKGMLDPEAITRFGQNRVFIASEGNALLTPRVAPALLEFDRVGKIIRSFLIPEKYLPESIGTPSHGVRNNCAFEGLALTPSASSLYMATECPLLQDGPIASFSGGAFSRVLRFRLRENSRTEPEEFAYRIEPNAKPDGALKDYGNGVSELLALSENQFLVLERGTASDSIRVLNRIRLFKVTLGKGETDISNLNSIEGRAVRPLHKELVLDFNSVLPLLNPNWASIDNLEAMTFGPRLSNGNRTLLFLSDDNFNPAQRTQILAFEVID